MIQRPPNSTRVRSSAASDVYKRQGVGDLLLAAHLPLAHRRDHLQLRVEGGDRGFQTDLVVALAGTAVGDRVAAGKPRLLDPDLGDQRPAERGKKRVTAAVEGVGADRG